MTLACSACVQLAQGMNLLSISTTPLTVFSFRHKDSQSAITVASKLQFLAGGFEQVTNVSAGATHKKKFFTPQEFRTMAVKFLQQKLCSNRQIVVDHLDTIFRGKI